MNPLTLLFIVTMVHSMKTIFSQTNKQVRWGFEDEYEVVRCSSGREEKGAFGSVCQVHRKNDGTLFVVKKQDWGHKKSFERAHRLALAKWEFEAMRRCNNHENVIKLVAVYWKDDQTGVAAVMEAGDGGDLFSVAQYLPQKLGKENPEIVLRIILQIARGLDYIHSQGIVHRDLKLENVVLSNDIAKIIDFGLSAQVGERNGAIVGSPEFVDPMAIHLGEGKYVWDPAADVYALGIIAYALTYFGYPYFNPVSEETLASAYSAIDHQEVKFEKGTDEMVVRVFSETTLFVPASRIKLKDLILRLEEYLKSNERPKVKELSLTNLKAYKPLSQTKKKKKTVGCFSWMKCGRALSSAKPPADTNSRKLAKPQEIKI